MTTDFDAFDILDQLEAQVINDSKTIKTGDCTHKDYIRESGTCICTNCGIELPNIEKERMKKRLEPGRCQVRKSDEKGIWKDVESLQFSETVVRLANEIFLATTKGHIYRGNSRKAVIFACIFHAYKSQGNPQSCDSLIGLFNLERKVALKGLKTVGLHAPKESLIRTSHITAPDLIQEIMKNFDAKDQQIQDVIKLYHQTKNCSSVLNRSRPQSVASGIVYYYVRLNNKNIPLKEFSQAVNLSELTVTKIAKEVARLLNTPDIML